MAHVDYFGLLGIYLGFLALAFGGYLRWVKSRTR